MSIKAVSGSRYSLYFVSIGFELIHHRVTQSLTELNRVEIKRIELRDTLCYSVVKTPFHSEATSTSYQIHKSIPLPTY